MSSTGNNGQSTVGEFPDVGVVILVLVNRIRAFKDQPRKYFDPERLEKLGRSLKRKQRLPINVRKIEGDPDYDYELVDGERRLRAAKLVGLEYLSALVVSVRNIDEQHRDSLISNFQREDLTPLEKAEGLNKLIKMGMSTQEIAEESGYGIQWVTNHLSLLTLAPEVQALMDPERPIEMRLTYSLALNMVNLPPDLQQELAEDIVDRKIPFEDARSIIRSKTVEAGKSVRTKQIASVEYREVSRFVSIAHTQSGRMAMKSVKSISVGVGPRSDAEVGILVDKIQTTIANLKKLAEMIELAKKVSNGRSGIQ